MIGKSRISPPGIGATAIIVSGLVFAPALAQEQAQVQTQHPIHEVVAEPSPIFAVTPLDDLELAQVTGRENDGWMVATATNSSVVGNNKVGDNNITGSAAVSDSAFQNASGITMVNINTGNNSSINAAMNVNLRINMAIPSSDPGS